MFRSQKMQQNKDDRLLSRSEVEEQFGISKRYLELAAMRGQGPAVVRLGRLVRYRRADLRAWIEANTSGGLDK